MPNSPELQKKGPYNQSPPDLIQNEKPPLWAQSQKPALVSQKSLQGPLMNICRDCKAMVVNIIRASRTSLAKAPDPTKDPVPDIPSRPAPRNFHLDLKPVYKQKKW